MTEITEKNKKAGLCYALANGDLELPVIDVTHPAFEIRLDEGELQALLQQYLQEIKGPEKTPAFLRQLLYGMMRNRSVIMRGLMGADGTFMSGLNTYLMKLGPDNLNRGYFSSIDRRIAGSAAGTCLRLRLQDMAHLLADALSTPLDARQGTPLHLFNIGGGPASDSLNALILIRKVRPDLLAERPIAIHSLDLDPAGSDFGAQSLASLLAEGAPLHGLQITFHQTSYDWSDVAQLGNVVASFGNTQSIMAASSEGALFEYGSDEDITGNLRVLGERTPADTIVVGSVTRADALGLKLNGSGVGSRAALRFRGLEAFTALALSSGWQVTTVIDRPLSHSVVLEKQTTPAQRERP